MFPLRHLPSVRQHADVIVSFVVRPRRWSDFRLVSPSPRFLPRRRSYSLESSNVNVCHCRDFRLPLPLDSMFRLQLHQQRSVLLLELHSFPLNVCDLQQPNANEEVYEIGNDSGPCIANDQSKVIESNERKKKEVLTMKPRPFTERPFESVFADDRL